MLSPSATATAMRYTPKITIAAFDSDVFELGPELLPVWLNENCAIRKNYGWDALIAPVDIHDEVCSLGVSLKANAQVLNIVSLKESLGAIAVRAIFSGVHHNLGGSMGIKVHSLQFY